MFGCLGPPIREGVMTPMPRLLRTMLVCALLLTLVISITACGSSEPEVVETEGEGTSTTDSSSSSESSSSESSSSETSSSDSSSSEGSESSAGAPVEIGATAIVGSLEVTLNNAFEGSFPEMYEPAEDYCLVLDVTVTNVGGEMVRVDGLLQATVIDADGNEFSTSISTPKPSPTGLVSPGRSLRGQMAFDASESSSYTFKFIDDLLNPTGEVSWRISRSQVTDGYVLVNSAAGQESKGEAAAVGDTVQLGELSITLSSVSNEPAGGDTRFDPERGAFVTVDLTITNTSSDTVKFSPVFQLYLLDEEAYKYAGHGRLNTIGFVSMELSPGEELSGEVTFDVLVSGSYELTVDESGGFMVDPATLEQALFRFTTP